MARHVLVVFSNPTAGKEDEYNEWYNKVHLPDVLSVPGFASAARFRISPAQLEIGDTQRPYKYLALYEIDTDDPAGCLKELLARVGTADMVMSDAIDLENVHVSNFTEITGRMLAKDVARPRRRA